MSGKRLDEVTTGVLGNGLMRSVLVSETQIDEVSPGVSGGRVDGISPGVFGTCSRD